MSGIVTLTTDFGGDGPYVAAMKGVLLSLAPTAQLVDVSHAIHAQDVREAGFVLSQVLPWFPLGTIHLAVVDPGVGTARRLVVVQAKDQWFVLPDNGLVGPSLMGRSDWSAWAIEAPAVTGTTVSATFHGRDILAPAAAHLLRGGDPARLGPPVTDLVLLDPVEPVRHVDGHVTGEVIYVDPFGNLITNILRPHLGTSPTDAWLVETPAGLVPLVRTYGDRPPGAVVALVGSSNRVEVAVVNGSAAHQLGLGRGTLISLRSKPDIDIRP